MMWMLLTLALMTPVWARPGSGQLVCYLVTDVEAKNINTIYTAVTDEKLYDRKGILNPLPSCSSSPGAARNTCVACWAEEQVLIQCLLTDPSAPLNFEAEGKGEELDKAKIPCVSTTTTAPPTLPMAHTSPPGLAVSYIGLIVVGVLGVLGVLGFLAAVAFSQREKIKSWMNRCSHTAVPTTDQELKMTPSAPAATSHAPSSPC